MAKVPKIKVKELDFLDDSEELFLTEEEITKNIEKELNIKLENIEYEEGE